MKLGFNGGTLVIHIKWIYVLKLLFNEPGILFDNMSSVVEVRFMYSIGNRVNGN